MHSGFNFGGPARTDTARPGHQIERGRDFFGYFLGVGQDELGCIERGIGIFWGFYGCIERGFDIFWGSVMMNWAVLEGELAYFWGFTAVLKGDWTFFGGRQ